jgi:DNA-binding NarL/FixJ family response regulator
MTIRVVLIDDHELIRQGLSHAFGRSPDFDVVGQAATISDGLAVVREQQPDVAIVDVRLPDGNGLEAVRTLRAEGATMGIVVLTMFAGDDQLLAALEAGASAFVVKDASAAEVMAAARLAAETPAAFTANDLAGAMQRRLNPAGPRLSPREQQVLQLLADGHAVPVIAKQLYISSSTAKTHVMKLYEKLGAQNRAQALMTALKLGLLSAEAPE